MLALGEELDRHVLGDPGERDVGLGAPQRLQRDLRHIVFAGHAGGCRQYAMGADEVAALADALAREPHGFFVVAPDILRIGGDAIEDRGKRIARAQPQRTACRA